MNIFKKVFIFVGPPGCGKSTIGKIVQTKMNITHISVGDAMRLEISTHSKLGKKLETYVNKGILVDNHLTNKVLMNRISQDDCSKGFILDGYPRSLHQLKDFNNILENINAKCFGVICFQIDESTIMTRLSNRTDQRPDDSPDIHQQRYKHYIEETSQLIEIFRNRGLVYDIDANNGIEEVSSSVLSIITKLIN